MIRENEPNHDDRQLFVACVFKMNPNLIEAIS